MAKATSVKIVRVPSMTGARRRAGALVRRGASAAARAAASERHTAAAVLGAAAIGWAQRSGTTLPHVASLGVAGTYGVLAWAVGRMTRSNVAQHVATGLLAVAAYQLTAGGGTSVSGDDAGEI
jgi:hypothetical protein